MAAPAVASTSSRQTRAAVSVSLLGWSFDLYDLFLILFLAPIIGPLLFPADSATLQLALVYTAFAVTVLMRPAGSAIFGHFADRHGRRGSLTVALVGIGVSTALMGAVPTYAAAGLLAPLLFLLLRVVQGLFVGGIVASSHTLGTETAGPRHRGLMSGLIGIGGAAIGAVLASLVFSGLSASMSEADLASYGWRIMFATGLVGSLISLALMRRVAESPDWAQARQSQAPSRAPLRVLLSPAHRGVFGRALLVSMGCAIAYYLTLGFFPTLLGSTVGLAPATAGVVLIAANAAFFLGGVGGGALSDRIGRRRVFLIFGGVSLVLGTATYIQFGGFGASDAGVVTLAAVVLALLVSATAAPLLIFLNERFPTEIRASGTALCWNLGFAVGGCMPSVVSYLTPTVADFPSRLAVFFAVAAALVLLGAAVSTERVRSAPAVTESVRA